MGNSVLLTGQETHRHPHWALVERIAGSQYFQSSVRLRDFLFYVADCALKGAPEEATEQQIGIHVFQRPAGYNSSEDSIVRSHARLLRQKLTEYFQNEGIAEETIIEIPKGHYLPVFRLRDEKPAAGSGAVSIAVRTKALAHSRRRYQFLAVVALVLCVAGATWWAIRKQPRDLGQQTAGSSAVDRFWGPFFANNSSLVIYSNALFIGDSTNGLRYAPRNDNGHRDDSAKYVDTYTGIGELNSVYELTRLFDSHHTTFTLKRSLLVTWDEASQRNLIFIGSVIENPALRVMPSDMDFTLISGNGFSGIVNRHPKPGELPLYARPEHPLTKDYAIIALLPGLESDRRILIFSGLMTLGTQAAVEFACRPDGLEQLLHAASGPDGTIRPFEAVIETTLGGDVPLQSKLVAIHMH